MSEKKFAMLGAGFWASYQLAAWGEVPGARCVGVCDPDRAKAGALAAKHGISGVFTDARAALSTGDVDFVDIVTPPATHAELIRLALSLGKSTICQKPVTEHLADGQALEREARAANLPLLVHENFRWQTGVRALKSALETGVIGEIYRARLTFTSGFPVFDNQPNLKTLERFLLADVGVHVLDIARFLFGESQSVYCHTRSVQLDVRGEDAATVMTRHSDVTVLTELSYVQNHYEQECFPETLARVEGAKGSMELTPDCWLRVTTQSGTHSRRFAPPRYAWADPAYEVAHASMVPCLANLLAGARGEPCETTIADNLQTMRLVEAAYRSAAEGRETTP